MKQILLLFSLVFPVFIPAQEISDFYFLEGRWTTSDSTFSESWTIQNDGSLKGEGVFFEEGNPATTEYLELRKTGDAIVYLAFPNGQKPVLFVLSDTTKGYSFVNRENDFPQIINYERAGDNEVFVRVSNVSGEGFDLHMTKSPVLQSHNKEPLFTNDAVVFGILLLVLGFVFFTSSRSGGFWAKFYSRVPALLLCYFIPGILNSLGIISGEHSGLYGMASRYLLPASLLLLCLGIDFKGIIQLGPKSLIMFFAATAGVVLGAPVALGIAGLIDPVFLQDQGFDSAYRGLSTIAGSWIGGGANQAAMKEVFEPTDKLFSIMVAVDVLVANLWMAILLLGAGNHAKVDRWLKADNSAISTLQKKLGDYEAANMRIPGLADTMVILAIAFGGVGLSHLVADNLSPWLQENAPVLEKFSLTSSFFWIVVVATTIGLLLSFTRARNYENVGASRLGSVFLYVLVATIGMNMDITAVVSEPMYFLVGLIWISVHAGVLILVAKLIRAPIFYAAVGSQANIGGAASAPVVAGAFHPSLAPVGVLLAVFGYALGTYAAWLCGIIMQSMTK